MSDRRLTAIGRVPIDARSGLEHYDALHMACRVKIGVGKLAEARVYANALAALPYFREQRHIGLGRRIEVDALAGNFDVALADAKLFERDWRRAGTPVAGNLAIGAYAAAMVHGMLGHGNARARWIEITRSLLPTPDRFATSDHLWRVTLDALLALHCGEPETANELLMTVPEQRFAVAQNQFLLWVPWYMAVWAETAALTAHPDTDEGSLATCRRIHVRQRHRRRHRRPGQGDPRPAARPPR